MQLYAKFDADGLRPAFYPDDVYPDVVEFGPKPEATEEDPDPVAPEISRARNPAIPSDAVAISHDQWQEILQNQGARRWDGKGVVPYAPPAALVVAPDCPSLPWWRTGLKLWFRTAEDGKQVSRYADVDAAISALEAAGDVQTQRAGILAREQFEYANSVQRTDLLTLAPAFKFTPADVDESLWRADQVRRGDLTGVWPPTSEA